MVRDTRITPGTPAAHMHVADPGLLDHGRGGVAPNATAGHAHENRPSASSAPPTGTPSPARAVAWVEPPSASTVTVTVGPLHRTRRRSDQACSPRYAPESIE